ncbi:DAHL domain-containing protein, partial [Caminibacter mediatlanticus]
MKNSKLYVSILSILGLVLIYFLFSKGNYFYEFLKQSSITQKQIDAIFHKELVVDEIVLKHSVYMYSNFDEIDKAIRMLRNRVSMLDKNDFFKTNYPQAYNFFKKYKVELNKKIDDIYRFETINSSLKNSFMFLLTYINQLSLNKDVSIYYYIKVVKVVSDIMLLKSTHDIDFFKN